MYFMMPGLKSRKIVRIVKELFCILRRLSARCLLACFVFGNGIFIYLLVSRDSGHVVVVVVVVTVVVAPTEHSMGHPVYAVVHYQMHSILTVRGLRV